MPSLMRSIKRLRRLWLVPTSDTASVRDLNQRFHPVSSGSTRLVLLEISERQLERERP